MVEAEKGRDIENRGVEASYEHIERGRGKRVGREGEGTRGQSKSRKVKREKGASSPLFSESGTPGCFWSLWGRT